jgi:mono/diheme cytochrome c family protein
MASKFLEILIMSTPFAKMSFFLSLILAAVLLTACGTTSTPAPAANAPASTEAATTVAPPTDTQTKIPPTETAAVAPTETLASSDVSFSADVLPILESRCVQCHGGRRTEGQLTLTTFDGIMAGGKDGAVVSPGDAANSPLYVLPEQGKMPKRGAKLTPVQLDTIMAWINAGALDN